MRTARRLPTLDACANSALADRGQVVGSLDGVVSQIASMSFLQPEDGAKVGVWESTPGRWPRAQASAEFCLIIAGHGRFEQSGVEPIELEPGVMVFFPECTNGLWVIEKTLRKIYVLL